MNFRLLSLVSAVLFLSACGVDEASIGGDEFGAEALSNDELALIQNGRFETFQSASGQYYFQLLAGNGQRVLISEGYERFDSSQNGISSVQTNGINEVRYLLREAADGSWYFVLTATNGQIVGMSEFYSTESNAKAGITSTINVVKNTNAQGPAAQGAPRFDTFRGANGRYYFNLRAANGQIVLQSQSYATRTTVNSAVNTVKVNGVDASQYELREARDGKHYFVLKAQNGRAVGFSEMYVTLDGAERGIASVMNTLASIL